MSNLFQLGDFTLASGQKSNFKIECDALTKSDWGAIASQLAIRTQPFSEIAPVPRGGVPLAEAMSDYISDRGPILIVDDVWTSGRSMRQFIIEHYSDVDTLGAVAFARTAVPNWVTALFKMT